MADEASTVRIVDWRELFPFTHLFRAFRVAIHPSKLIIALVALASLWIGGLILDGIWLNRYTATPKELSDLGISTEVNAGVFHTFFNYEVTQANNILMLKIQSGPFDSVWNFIKVGPLWLWEHHWFFALVYTAYFLLVWSVFGGAISRIAAVHVARDEKISVRHAMSFSVGKIISFIFAPVIPAFIVLVIGLIIAVPSWVLLHIPYASVIVGLSLILALIGGFIITLVLLGTIGGFNLMYPTVAVEGSDSFDAISRSFSYVFARPWRMLWYTAVSVVYGAVCYLFVRFFVWMMLAVTYFFVTWFLGGNPPINNTPADVFARMWPMATDPLSTLPHTPDYDHLKGSEVAAAGLIQFWVYLTIGLIGAFAISFYFSANTIIYYLMRREVDATDLDDVYIEDTDDDLDAGEGPADLTVAAASIAVVDEVPAPESPGEG